MSYRVTINTWSGAFFNPGGGEVQLLNTKKALEERGLQVELFNQWQPQTDFDIFHQFSIQLGANYVVDEYKKIGRKIALSTILWADFEKSDFFYWQIRDLLLKADILFTNSEAESEKLAKSFEIDLEKFHKTRNSITEDYLSDGDPNIFRDKFGIRGDFVLSVGNIDRRKNTKALVEACSELNLKLVVIGAIRDHEYFKEFENHSSKVLFLGPITSPDLIKSAYRACTVFALPSLCETPGIAALEAASQGARIVITNQGPTAEYFGRHAIYVDPRDMNSIVEGVRSGMRAEVLPNQAGCIREQFTWRNTASDVCAGYLKILG